MAVLFDIEDNIISQTFGNRDIDSTRSFLNDTNDHLSTFLDWLRNRIAFSEHELSGDNDDCYYKQIQDLYNEDPKRCLRWHIYASPSHACPLLLEDVVYFYSEEWNPHKEFIEPKADSLFDITPGMLTRTGPFFLI